MKYFKMNILKFNLDRSPFLMEANGRLGVRARRLGSMNA